MRTSNALLIATLGLSMAAAGVAFAQTPQPVAKPVPARAASPAARATPSRGIIVQGGLTPEPGCSPQAVAAGTPAVAIGPKQDDPAPKPSLSAAASNAHAASGAAVAIGPKQDDPRPPTPEAVACHPATR